MPIRINEGAVDPIKVTFTSPPEVVIDHTNDSIRLGDGTDLVTTTTVGSDIGLDVNIISPIDIEISHTEDSIRIGDGTDLVNVTSDGKLEVSDSKATTPTIYNIISPGTANTEFSQALTTNTKKFTIRNRGKARLQFSFISGESGTNYITVWPGSNYTEVDLDLTSVTIYIMTAKASQTVEILEWV